MTFYISLLLLIVVSFVVAIILITRGPRLRNFKRIKHNLNIKPLLLELSANEDAWSLSSNRQKMNQEQKETETILLRNAVSMPGIHVLDQQDTADLPYVKQRFPKFSAFLQEFIVEIGGELGRAMIVRLKPRKQVYRHFDYGEYYRIRNRYHLVLVSPVGSVLESGGEKVRMREGELWWFNNKKQHEAFNEGDSFRIHLIFDVLPPGRYNEARIISAQQKLDVGIE